MESVHPSSIRISSAVIIFIVACDDSCLQLLCDYTVEEVRYTDTKRPAVPSASIFASCSSRTDVMGEKAPILLVEGRLSMFG
jgi:hypothetical protein